jgi:hypothetical protein
MLAIHEVSRLVLVGGNNDLSAIHGIAQQTPEIIKTASQPFAS